MSRKKFYVPLIAGMTVFFIVALGSVAIADNTISDGDGITPVANSNLSLGTVCASDDATADVLVAINRNGAAGSTNVFKDGSTVTVSVLSTTGSGLSAIVGSPNSIGVPSDWGEAANNTVFGAVAATVTLNTSTLGSFSGSVVFRGAGVNSSNASINRDDTMLVTATVEECIPADTTPPVITPNVSGTLGSSGWYTSNVDVSWTISDPESAYTIDDGCVDQTLSSETTGTSLYCTATSGGGTTSESVTVKIDKTGPTAALAVTAGTAGANGWYTSDVTVSTSGSDDVSSPVTCTADQNQTTETAGQALNGSCTNDAGLTSNAVPLTVKLDKTGPTATLSASGTLGNNGWYTSDVTISASGNDTISNPTACTADQSQTVDTASATFNGSCTNDAGLTTNAAPLTMKRDATDPTLNPSVSPNPVELNGSATASPNASDNLSGVFSSSCDPVNTSTIGSHSVACSAEDNAGNTASANASYNVAYKFLGFFAPVDNLPALNMAKAGQAIPLKWRLTDANGVPVLNLTAVNVTVASLSCSAGVTTDAIEEYATGSSDLQNLGDGYYQFNWKTPTSYASSCKTLKLDLGEGAPRTANFQFKK